MGGARVPRCALLGCRALSREKGMGLPLRLWPQSSSAQLERRPPFTGVPGLWGRTAARPRAGPGFWAEVALAQHLGSPAWDGAVEQPGGGPSQPSPGRSGGAFSNLPTPGASLESELQPAGGWRSVGAHMSSDVDAPRVTPLLGGAWPMVHLGDPSRGQRWAGGWEHQLSPAVGRGCTQPSPISPGPPPACKQSPVQNPLQFTFGPRPPAAFCRSPRP